MNNKSDFSFEATQIQAVIRGHLSRKKHSLFHEKVSPMPIPEKEMPQYFRKAAASLVISDAELWIEFNKKRGDTSHDYCGDKAGGTFEIIPDFIKEAISLYETISGVKWQN